MQKPLRETAAAFFVHAGSALSSTAYFCSRSRLFTGNESSAAVEHESIRCEWVNRLIECRAMKHGEPEQTNPLPVVLAAIRDIRQIKKPRPGWMGDDRPG